MNDMHDKHDKNDKHEMSTNSELLVAANQKLKEKKFWQQRLSGDLFKTSFPADLAGPLAGQKGAQTAVYSFSLPPETAAAAIKISGGSDLRLFVVLASALTLLMRRYGGKEDIMLAAPVNRSQSEGELINTLLIVRQGLTETMSFKELILAMGKSLFEAAEHQNYPLHLLPQLVPLSLPGHQADGSFPLLDTAVLLENIHQYNDLQRLSLETVFSFNKTGSQLTGQVHYNIARFSEARIRQIANHLLNLLQHTLAAVDTPLGQCDILSQDEHDRLRVQFNQPAAADLEGFKESTILTEFEQQARRVPDFLALVETCSDGPAVTYTYERLNSRASQLARSLEDAGAAAGSVVAVSCKRSAAMVAAMLAVFKARCTFLPLPVLYPSAMRRFFLEDSGAAALFIDRDPETGEIPEHLPVLRVDSPADNTDTGSQPATLTDSSLPLPSEPAYILYTTGTGEKPAAVTMPHRAIYSFIHALYRRFDARFGVGDKCLSITDTSLDLGICELFLPLVFGCTLVIAPDQTLFDPAAFARLLLDQSITFAFIPAGVLEETALQLKPEKAALQLDKLLLGGTPVAAAVLDTYRSLRRSMQICFGYGPVEAAVCSTMYSHPVPRESLFGDPFQAPEPAQAAEENFSTAVPAGKPLGGAQIMVLDNHKRLCPIGVTGDLWISGSRLASGYVNRPGLTARTFIPNPFASGLTMVTGGDTGSWDEDGNIHIGPPIDDLIKINGYRFHPGEIRGPLVNHEAVADAYVTLRSRQGGDSRDSGTGSTGSTGLDGVLCAYLLPSGQGELPKTHEWVALLSQSLPAYMIPLYFITLDSIPVTAGGRVDVNALPDPNIEGKSSTQFVAPENELQQAIAETWKNVLNKESIGVDDNFFEIGGNSLGILKLKDQLRKQLGHEIPDIKFLEYPTIRTFHAYLENEILGDGSAASSAHDEHEDDIDQDDAGGRLRMRSRLLDDDEDDE